MADIKSVFNDETGRWCLWHGDCRTVISRLSDNSIDSIVTDPPYELGFMGKSWDSTGIAYDVGLWRECLRVLKPGGHLLAFGGSRTYHRLACAVEDAGFEIRDQIMWVYGSGFPKSLNVSKAIDKAAGVEFVAEPASGVGFMNSNNDGYNTTLNKLSRTGESTDDAKQWAGWGTALKPAHEPIVMARKPLEGTVASNVLKHGTGAINIDKCRIGTEGGTAGAGAGAGARVFGNGLNGTFGKIVEGLGRWPANFIHDGSKEVTDLFPQTASSKASARGGTNPNPMDWGNNRSDGNIVKGHTDNGGSAARFFYCAKASKSERNAGLEELDAHREHDGRQDGGVGGDNPRNRSNTPKQNFHPTVKPIALMRYLIRMVTPPEGVVLEPFAGSGTTMVAGLLEGFTVYGCELTDDYLPIIQARVQWALNNMDQPGLF